MTVTVNISSVEIMELLQSFKYNGHSIGSKNIIYRGSLS